MAASRWNMIGITAATATTLLAGGAQAAWTADFHLLTWDDGDATQALPSAVGRGPAADHWLVSIPDNPQSQGTGRVDAL